MIDREKAVKFLKNEPSKFGRLLGFSDLTDLHNGWMRYMLLSTEDKTLQAHRGSYKTTCVSIVLALIIILLPRKRILFVRKTDDDIKEIILQVKNILLNSYTLCLVKAIYGIDLRLTTASTSAITTNLSADVKGTPQLSGQGISGSLTGKHYDIIFTDDIVNLKDRYSKAERDHTKQIYQELQNIKNRGGRIFNTGTPWHKDDCFSIMPAAEVFDCYSTGLMSEEEIAKVKDSMTASLFAANYELRHIAEDDIIFADPQTGAEPSKCEQGLCHIDAAYGGEDYTAFTIVNRIDGIYYVFGKCWRKHIDDVTDEIIKYRNQFNAGRIFVEDNGDKGYLGKALRNKGERVTIYHESMNKFVKISTHLKSAWKCVIFIKGTDNEYINQICDYNENAEHDDCPDSLSSLLRLYARKSEPTERLW